MSDTRRNASPSSHSVFRGLKAAGIDLVTSVPCVKLGEVLELISTDRDMKHVPVTREEEGIGICAGAYLGGRRPALLMQNSGLGNCINALASLDLLYGLPILLVLSHRGTRRERIKAQMPMGQATVPLLDVLGIAHYSPPPTEGEETILEAARTAFTTRRPAAVLLDLEYWRA